MSGDRSAGARVLVALGLLIGALSLTAAMSGSPAMSPDRPTVTDINGPDVQSLVAILVLGLAFVGFVLLVVSLIMVQRGAGKPEGSKKRSIMSTIIMALAVMAALRWLPRNDAEPTPLETAEGEFGGTTTTAVPIDLGQRIPLGPIAVGLVVLVLLAAAAVVVLMARRPAEVAPTKADAARRRVADDITITIDDLLAEPDPRRAVLMAYQRLEATFMAQGVERDESQTPGEFLGVALDHLSVAGTDATRLTELFDLAMFSPSTIDRTMQERAADALRAVRDDLARSQTASPTVTVDGVDAGR